MEPIIFLIIAISFVSSIIFIPYWIKKAEQVGLVWEDMNKLNSGKVAGSGGLIPILGFLIGLFSFVAYRTFFLGTQEYLIEILSVSIVVLTLACIGLIDDLLGWQKGGLSKTSRLFLVLLASVPLIVINAGKSLISIPILGTIDAGIIYPLILIPLGIVGASVTFNMIAGFNGLEAGQGIILLSALAFVSYLVGNSWLSVIAFCMVASLFGFIFYNKFPAKVFPGNSLTLCLGAIIAMMAILGNFEKIAVFFFIPYIVEVFLKSRGNLKMQSFGKPLENGNLELRYKKFYGIEHIAIYLLNKTGIKANEKKVVILLWAFQILIILIGIYIFRNNLWSY